MAEKVVDRTKNPITKSKALIESQACHQSYMGVRQREEKVTYPVISQRCQTLSYPLFGVPVADCDVECEDNEHAQENGPLDNDASLVIIIMNRVSLICS